MRRPDSGTAPLASSKYPKVSRIPKIYACSAGLGFARLCAAAHFISIVKNMPGRGGRGNTRSSRIKHELALPEAKTAGHAGPRRLLDARALSRRFGSVTNQQADRRVRGRIV